MKFLPALAVSALLLLPAGQAQTAEIIISAAASLTNAFTEAKVPFEKTNPGVTMVTNFAASNPLLQQMRLGAPVDVFASADQETMDKAEKEHLIVPTTRQNFAANSLVMIVPAGEEESAIKGVADLGNAKRIAIGNPDSVPAGRYARAALQASGQWDALTPVLVQGESVRQVLDYVSRGEVDAGFVYATDAFVVGDKVQIVATMTGHDPILYSMAVASSAREKEAAQAFVDFLFTEEGMNILKGFGFTPVQ